jgi:predicted NBD/HSP70 family sugar kinase
MRIGLDLGGTKIEGVVMDERSYLIVRERVAAPQSDYRATLETIAGGRVTGRRGDECGERLRRDPRTGVGGGIAIGGQLLRGPNAIAGEWGHNPLPWIRPEWGELPGACWCRRHGCIEIWLSGVGEGEPRPPPELRVKPRI